MIRSLLVGLLALALVAGLMAAGSGLARSFIDGLLFLALIAGLFVAAFWAVLLATVILVVVALVVREIGRLIRG